MWSEDVGHAVMATPYAPGYVTAGAWSPTRAGMALTLDGGGRLAAWDWVHRQDAPALEVGGWEERNGVRERWTALAGTVAGCLPTCLPDDFWSASLRSRL